MESSSSPSTYLIKFHRGGVFYDSEREDVDTASVDHLSNGEEEVFDVRTRKPDLAPKPKRKKMFDANFLSRIYNGLLRKEYSKKDVFDKDNLGDHWLIHDPNIKWKLMRHVLGERLWASWMQNEKSFQIKKLNDEHACSRTYEYGILITSNWIARNYAKKIMINPCIKVKEIIDLILKKYKCKVNISQARRRKEEALKQYETCLEDHYGMLWTYAYEILNSDPSSTCWLQGCRRVIGIDGCFLETICKGELLSVVGRDGNNKIYHIAWVVVNGIVEAAKEVMPLAEH
ncbi:hypothetical protein Tco_1427835 [Tanacetum coccineum]